MAFKVVNGTETDQGEVFYKWTTMHQTFTGVFRGVKPGKYGPDSLMCFTMGANSVVMPNNTVFRSAFKKILVGSLVQIVYLGKKRGQSGAEYMDFQIAVDDGPVAESGASLGTQDPTPPTPYGALLAQIRQAKGEGIATMLGKVAAISNDPLAALREAAQQLGIDPEPVPF